MKKALEKTIIEKSSPIGKPLSLKYRFLEGLAISYLALGLFLGLSMLSYKPAITPAQVVTHAANNMGGQIGYHVARWLFLGIGSIAYLFPPMVGYLGVLTFKNRLLDWPSDYLLALCQVLGFSLIIVAGCGFNASFNIHHHASYPGGLLGFYLDFHLGQFLGEGGIRLFLATLLLAGVTLLTGFSWIYIVNQLITLIFEGIKKANTRISHLAISIFKWIQDTQKKAYQSSSEKAYHTPPMPSLHKKERTFFNHNTIANKQSAELTALRSVSLSSKKINPSKVGTHVKAPLVEKMHEAIQKHHSHFTHLPPSLDLLDPLEDTQLEAYSPEELELLSREVENRLKDFGIDVAVVGGYPGPVVTRFEIQLAPGVKASRITTLATDLARSLSVVSVRVVEIIPGKSVVGLELPNRNREMVRLRDNLDSIEYSQAPSPLSMALGKDIGGKPVIVDLAKMPHLLVAGTTGSGKSVGLNAMILSLLYKSTPNELRLIMIDPKMLELSIYDAIPHLLSPVVTDMKKAANALRWCIGEMERRYKLMSLLGMRNLQGYNQTVTTAAQEGKPLLNPMSEEADPDGNAETLGPLPYIVVVVDEFADMVMVVGKKVEELIARLAQKARAAGIHLILATQRPSVDVITGLIKANIPTRIAFQVSSRIDSRTILDQQGAEQLLGHGDMLYMAPGTGIPVRVHGAFVSDHEVHKVVEAVKKAGPPDYQVMFSESSAQDSSDSGSNNGLEGEQKELYDKAVAIVLKTRRASISNVQRNLRIGYNRAANLLEEMEKAGLVSSMESNGKREILIPNTHER